MEAVLSFLSANTLFQFVVIALLIVVVVGILKGSITFKGHGLTIEQKKDVQDVERIILLEQWEYIHSKIEAEGRKLPPGLKEDKTKYILARVEDVFQKAMVVNHVTLDDVYIGIKADMVVDTVQKRAEKEYFFSKEFVDWVNIFTKEIIQKCLQIRASREKK